MYTQFQRFVATILLFSILLQSCGNPNWKMAEADSPAASGETSEPSKAKKRAPANLLQVQDEAIEDVRDFDGAPKGKGATKALAIRPRGPASASSAALLGAASYVQPTAPSRAAHRDGRLSTSPLTPVRSPGVPATSQRFYSNRPSQSPGPLTARKNPAKPRHVVLGKASMALRQAVPRVHARTIAPTASARPTAPPIKTLQPTPQAIIPTHKEKAVVLKSAAAPVASSGTLVGPFPVASAGKEVVFSQVEGCWTAVVRETWGTFTREESLPVLCKGDVLAALHNLQGKAAIHTKRHIHILETHQPPWAPKVVYVGTLGVRGGGFWGNVWSGVRAVSRGTWGLVSLPFNAIAYVFKKEIPPLSCRVTVLPKLDVDDLCNSEVNNSCKVAGELVSFYERNGYWWAKTCNPDHESWLLKTMKYQENLDIPVKANHSVALSLEDLVNSQFSFYKARKEKSLSGFVAYNFVDYEATRYYEIRLITSPEEVQTNKEARRRQRRERKKQEEERKKQEEERKKQEEERKKQEEERKKQEEERKKQEEERKKQEEERKKQELEQKKEADREALLEAVGESVSANFYTSLDQAGSLSETHAAQQHSMVQSLARELTQGQSGSLEHEVIKDGYLSDDELDYDVADNTGSGLDFGPTDDQFPMVGPREAMGAEENKEEVPSSTEALAERILHKKKCAQAYDKQERDLQRTFHVMLQEASGYLVEWSNISSEDHLDPSVQSYLQGFHQTLLALPSALSDWEQSLQGWKKSLDNWASSLHQSIAFSLGVDLNLGDYQEMLGHYQRAEKLLTKTQGQYQALSQEVVTFLSTPHYYTALTAPQLQQQAISLAQNLVQVANNSALTQAHALQKSEQASQIAQARNEKAQDQLASVHKKLVRKQVVVMAHTLDHKPLLDYLAGKGHKYINEKDDQGKTALRHAIIQHQLEVVQWLLDHGADKEVKDGDGLTPLHLAAQEGHTDTVAWLLEGGAVIEASSNDGLTPLHLAAQEGHTDTVAWLLEGGAVIEASSNHGSTPLCLAALQGHHGTVKLLLDHGAAIEAKEEGGFTPLHCAAQEGHTDTVALLLERGAAIEAKNREVVTPLHYAAQGGHTDTVALLLEGGAAIEASTDHGSTPLHLAALKGHHGTVAWLLERGAAIEAKEEGGFTPLHCAAQEGHTDTFAWLLEGGAAIEARSDHGSTPLHCAALKGHHGTVAWLLDHGAAIEASNDYNSTPLHWAAQGGHTDTVALLLERGAAIEAEEEGGFTPLHCAAQEGHTDTVALLLERGAAVAAKKNDGRTPLDIAVTKGHEAVATLLRAAQAPNWRSRYHHSGETDTASQVREEGQPSAHVPDQPPVAAVSPAIPSQQRRKDSPALAQAKAALDAVLAVHKSAQETAAAAAQALQESQVAKEHARGQSHASVLHLQTMQQHVTRLLNVPPALRCVTYYLKSITDDAKDYLQSLVDGFASEEQQRKGNDLLATLYAWRQQEQQHYRHVEQLLLYDAALRKDVQVPLLSEILPQYQFHIDTLSNLIHQLVETGHVVATSDSASPSASSEPEAVAQATDQPYGVPFPEDATALQRIAQLGATLPASLQKKFQENIAPILQEKLLQAPPALQDTVFHYFQDQGAFYPKVLRQHSVQDWVRVSLFHDLAQGTSLSDAAFIRFNRLATKLQEQYLADVLTAVLWELKNKKVAHMLSLDELCDVMDMLPEEGAEAQAFLQLPSNQWCATLKRTWCRQAIAGCCPHLDAVQRQHLIQELSYLNWSLQATQTLLRQLPHPHSTEDLSRLLAFTVQHPIDDDLLLEILAKPAPAQGNVITHWHHQLACSLLENKLSKLLPQEIQESTYTLIENMWARTPTYRSINSLLEQLFLKKLKEDEFILNAEHLHLVLAMVQDYRLDDATCTKLFQQLTSLPSHQWQQYFYTQILQHCFAQESHERTVPEIIEYIATHSPEVAYVQDQVAFGQAHRAILEAYQAASKILPNKQAIASWDAATITQWAQTVKGYAQNPGKGALPTQSELIAVVKRAVELCHRFPPRNTQLLSLLVLLNPTPGQGRLVQINTGEGKSLTVAMFSAIKALLNSKSDIVTTSTELSIPEVAKQLPFFKMLALSVSENSDKDAQDSGKKKQQAYQHDNVYGVPADFQGDILRGEFFGKELRMQRPFDCVVVDEVDNMLFDSRSHSIRLSSTMPATNHLEILLAATWQRVKYMASHLVKDQNQVYYIEEDFQKDKNGHITILSGEERDPKKCMYLIEGTVEDFIKEPTEGYLELLLRDLNSDEKEAYQASQKLEREISVLRADLVNEKNPERHKAQADQLEQLEEKYGVLPWNVDKKKYPPIVSVPVHLKNLAKQQVPRWIQSATAAALVYKKGHHYDVHGGKIVPVDYDNTGVWQHNMVWSNGLAQFLQIKEGLKVSPENISTNFISTVGFFQRYAKQLYGLTGTLGNEVTQEFFKKVYNTDLVIVPPYKQRLIVGNIDSRYACKELTPRLIVDKDINKWYDAIEASALQHAQQQRAVLIICKYIRQVHALEARLQERYAKDKIFTYTGKKKFKKEKVHPGEIIIATNIAGRGTDLTPSELVEHYGGLHVCITFLPESYRVEVQNAGRTARQGGKGTTQLILHQPEATSIEALRQQRDEQEAKDLQQAIDEVKNMTFKDELFQRFCQVENKLIPTLDGFERLRHSELLEQAWAIYAQDGLAPEALRSRYEKHIAHLVQTGLDAIPSTQWNSLSHQEKQAQKENAIKKGRTDHPFEEFQKAYHLIKRREAIQAIQTELGSKILHPGVVKAFEEGRKYVPENGELAVKYGWGPYERKAVEEHFGLWFHQHMPQKKESINFETLRAAFESFLQEIEKDAKANNLIHNAFFYVQKGNCLLQSSGVCAAVAAYDKAIALDPDFSLHARYNKAMALLTPEKNKHHHAKAKSELREAKILVDRYKNDLFIFQSIIGYVQPPKPQTAQHLQHHLDILFQQDHHIDAAIGVIEAAQNARKNKGNDVRITKFTEIDALFDQDAAQEHREQALAESRENGLSVFFNIEEKIPKPWLSICAVALIGLVQIAAAVFATIGTAGTLTTALLNQGISDLVTAISSAISGKFSWKEWGISKAISIGISLVSASISAGLSKVKQGFEKVREGVQKGVKEIAQGTTKANASLMGQIKDVALAVSKGLGQECTLMLLNQGVQEIAGEALEEKITQAVSEDIMRSMLKSDFIKRAMANDIAKGRDYWGQIFIKEGLAMLSEKDSVLYTLLKGIIQGTALQKLTQHIQELYGKGSSKTDILSTLASVGLPMLSGFLADIHGFTDTFLENFHARLEQKYAQELARMETKTSATEQPIETATKEAQAPEEQEFMRVMDAQVHLDDDELQLHDLNNGQEFSTQAKVRHQQVAIDPTAGQADRTKAMGAVLTSNVSAQLLGKVNQHLINPLTSLAVGAFMDFATSGITERVREERDRTLAVHRVSQEQNKLVNTAAKTGQAAEKADAPDTAAATGQAAEKADAPEGKDFLKTFKGSEGNVIKCSVYSTVLERYIEVSDEKDDLTDCIGTGYKSDDKPSLEAQYTPHPNATKATDTIGHFQIPNSAIKVTPSGPLNCLEDSLVAQLSEDEKAKLNIHTGQDLRDRGLAYLVDHPEYAQQSNLHYQTLRYYDPAALLRGGNIVTVSHYMQHYNPHSTYNKNSLAARDLQYAALQEEVKLAAASGNQEQVTALKTQLREMEVAAFEARLEARRQQIKDFCEYAYLFVRGLGNAVSNDLSLGAISRKYLHDPAFFHGQMLGDGLSFLCGASEFFVGKGIMGGGELVMVVSGGVLVSVAVPISAGGVAVASHGVMVMGQALLGFSKLKEGQYVDQKYSGPNDPHTNRKAKSSAQKNYEDARVDLAKYQSENRGKPIFDKKEEARLKNQVKHWKKKADATGETHSRKGKGKR